MKESIIGINRSLIVDLLATKVYGLIGSSQGYYDLIVQNTITVDRASVENDSSVKQLIPYVILTYNAQYFLLTRKSKQSEQRLHNKMSLGIGGHINPSDTSTYKDLIINGLFRELNEEVHILNHTSPEFIGFINDDLSDVGSVHLGLLYKIELADGFIEVLEKDKMEGSFVSLGYLRDNYERLESWSKIVYDEYLLKTTI